MNHDVAPTECPRCQCSHIIIDTEMGEEVCSKCGLVIPEGIFDMGPEWRAFTKDESAKRSRVGTGASLLLYDKGISTTFNQYRDARGNSLDMETISKMSKLKSYDRRSKLNARANGWDWNRKKN